MQNPKKPIKRRALIRTTISVTSIKRGPERIDDNKQVDADLECLKKNYPDFKEAWKSLPNDPFYEGETDKIFQDGTCDE